MQHAEDADFATRTFHRDEIRLRDHVELLEGERQVADYLRGGKDPYLGPLPFLNKSRNLASLTITTHRIIDSTHVGMNGGFVVIYIPISGIADVKLSGDGSSLYVNTHERGKLHIPLRERNAIQAANQIQELMMK